jgi:Protein of unknown function (DUF3305)
MVDKLTLALDVTVKQEISDHVWQTRRWRAVSCAMATRDIEIAPRGAPVFPMRSPVAGLAYASLTLRAALVLEYHEVSAYLINLMNGQPTLYVVVSDQETGVCISRVSASPFALSPFESPGVTSVDRVAMGQGIAAHVARFVQAHVPPATQSTDWQRNAG